MIEDPVFATPWPCSSHQSDSDHWKMVPKIPVSWGGILGRNVRGPVFFNMFCKWEIIEIVLVTITCCSSKWVAWVSCVEVRVGTLASVYCHYVSFVSIMAVLQSGETGCWNPILDNGKSFLLTFLLFLAYSKYRSLLLTQGNWGRGKLASLSWITWKLLQMVAVEFE